MNRGVRDKHECAGGSEVSDAMSEGERKDEVSSLHADGQDHGVSLFSSPLVSTEPC